MKETYYFQHDYNAANDQKVLKLRAKHGNESYAVFFMMLEMMAQEATGILPDDFIDMFCLSYGYANGSANGTNYPQQVLNTCLEIGLFIKDERGIFSERMLAHKQFRVERSLSGRKGADKKWNNSSANGSAMAQPMQRKGKERKEKDIKRNTIKENILKEKDENYVEAKQSKPEANVQAKTELFDLPVINNAPKHQPKDKKERETEFRAQVKAIGTKYPTDLLDRFCDYWTESSPNDKKMLFEKRESFDMVRRLARFKFNNYPNSQYSTEAPQQIRRPKTAEEFLKQHGIA